MSTQGISPTSTRKLPHWVWGLLIGSSAALLLYSILRALRVPMTFDEVWSLNSYATASWGDILAGRPATANNHIGNSLLMKLCVQAFGDSPLSLRLPNLVAHGIFLIYTIQLARRFRQGIWVLLAFLLLNFHPFLLDFFSLARGYGLAMAMVMGALYHLFAFRENAFSRHIVWNVIYASLAVGFNFSFLHFFLADASAIALLILSHARAWDGQLRVALWTAAKRLTPLVIASVGLYIFMRGPVKGLLAANELYYGGHTGFWTDTVASLAHAVLYKIDYWRHDVDGLMTACLISLLLMFVAFAIELTERAGKLRESPGMVALWLLLCPAVTCTVQHYQLGSPFLIYRTAIFLLPIYMLALVWLLRTIAKVEETRKVIVAVSIVITLALASLNVVALNTTHTAEWISDADTPAMLRDLQADRAALGNTGPVQLGLSWPLRPVTNYYRTAMGLDDLAEATNKGCQPGMDYYFILKAGDGCKLPADQLPFGKPQGCTLLKTYPLSNTALWRGPAR